jgi:hypothetical protein
MDKTSRAILGFAVAPFVPTALFCAAITLPTSGRIHWNDLWGAGVVVFQASMLITVPITLLVGLPVYLAIEKHRNLRLHHVLVTSGVVGAAVGLLLASPHIGALLGLSAGITFWVIWHRARDERRPF